ncbi:cytochrome c oxidase assembly protein CtaG/Cox11-domain-containing protein [Russula ochroleuca]|uniref:Cytochrome c oxidase assembly protein CtaG/Cox11-domain-containing protein n=1 Tax=Russula ochroleuca TaxID=152965 RepID=A0A9P5N4I9_9AGAM|nr:cytochrome c oxidase assembly protein CtaG/Cox11-domain-containing protein [Russula ochroleuca]
MAAILQSLKRPLRTNIHRTRHYSNGVYLSGLGAAPYLNRLHPRLDTSRCAHGVPWRKSTLSCSRLLSTHTPPLPNLPRARLVSARELYAQRNRSLFMYTSAVIVLAVGASYAAVPLYRMFCAATGFAGTPVVGTGRFEAERLVPIDGAKRIKVHFNADRSEQLPWTFTPQQKYVTVLPGETSLAFYKAKNNADYDVIGIATYNVTPDRIAPYFAKVECFCFEEQKLLAGEEVDMPLLFFIDKDVLEDPACRNLDDIVLSYTFFKARRNAQGQLEPDAPEDTVQASQGWSDVKFAPKTQV